MKDTLVVMKDGTKWCGPMYFFRPVEGWFSVMENGSPEKIYFKDVESAVTKNVMTHFDTIQDVDELQRAREQGWKP